MASPARKPKKITKQSYTKTDKGLTAQHKRSPWSPPHLDPRTPMGFLSHKGNTDPQQQAASNTMMPILFLFSDFFQLAPLLPAFK